MTPKWQKLASLAQEICTLWFQFYGAIFATKGYPFKNIFSLYIKKEKLASSIGCLFVNKSNKFEESL